MRHRLLTITALFLCTLSSAQEIGFKDPPRAARPQVWWYWIDGNISKEGIRADLYLTEMEAEVSSSGGVFTVEMLSNGDLADGAELPLNPAGTHSWIQISFPESKTIRSLTLAGGQVREDFAFAPSYDNYLICSDNGSDWQEVCRIPSCSVWGKLISSVWTLSMSPASRLEK